MVARPRTEEANAATKTEEGSTLQQDTEDVTLGVGHKGTRMTPHQDLSKETEMYEVDVVNQRVVSMTMTSTAEAVAVAVRVVGLKLVETVLVDGLVLVSARILLKMMFVAIGSVRIPYDIYNQVLNRVPYVK